MTAAPAVVSTPAAMSIGIVQHAAQATAARTPANLLPFGGMGDVPPSQLPRVPNIEASASRPSSGAWISIRTPWASMLRW
jgi:hypothetical protein